MIQCNTTHQSDNNLQLHFEISYVRTSKTKYNIPKKKIISVMITSENRKNCMYSTSNTKSKPDTDNIEIFFF